MVAELNDTEFEKKVLNNKGGSVVDFWAPWCGPCKILSPIVEKVSNEMKHIKFFKVNVDEHQKYAQEFGVMSIPTVILFKDGQEVERFVGALPETQLKKKISTALE